ncbi:unnamed protein product [Schistosoma margrebowiei]|uniref:Cytochrome c oxidase assembly factor 6 n=1 Tax=Schistosoma margrebowiei TaxID=48269 RepID=A0AA84ZII9_9TREM|nr:unnamed protein product [Schistosoma margrebowiei]
MKTSTDFISKSKREKCWKSRDAFWECVTDVIAKNSEPDDKLVRKQCNKQRKLYEEMCPRIWFDNKPICDLSLLHSLWDVSQFFHIHKDRNVGWILNG